MKNKRYVERASIASLSERMKVLFARILIVTTYPIGLNIKISATSGRESFEQGNSKR